MFDMQVEAERSRQSFARAVLRGANGSFDIGAAGAGIGGFSTHGEMMIWCFKRALP